MDVRLKSESRTGTGFLIENTRLPDVASVLSISENLGFSGQAWRSLIADGNSVCAKDSSNQIVGFYAANHLRLISDDGQFHELRSAMNVLCNRFKLEANHIAFGAQSVVATSHEGSNLRAQMLRALLRNIGLRYQHLFTFCKKQNSGELDALLWEGWRCFQEEDEVCYLTLDAAKTLRRLASELLLRAPISAPSPRLPIQTSTNRAGA